MEEAELTVENLGYTAVVARLSNVDIQRHGVQLDAELSADDGERLLNLSQIAGRFNGVLQNAAGDLRQDSAIGDVHRHQRPTLQKHIICTDKNLRQIHQHGQIQVLVTEEFEYW